MLRPCSVAIVSLCLAGCACPPAPPARRDEGVLVVVTPPRAHPDAEGLGYVGYEVLGADGRIVRWTSGLYEGQDTLALAPGLYAVRGLEGARLTDETRLVAVLSGQVTRADITPPDVDE